MRSRPELRAGTRTITSLQNERVKLIRSLEMRKARRETGLFVAEGTSLLLTRTRGRLGPQDPTVSGRRPTNRGRAASFRAGLRAPVRSVSRCRRRCLPSLPARTIRRICWACSNSAGPACPKLGPCREGDLWLALEAPRDPGNLGTILRTSEAVAASGVILIGHSCDPYSREACAPAWARSSRCR